MTPNLTQKMTPMSTPKLTPNSTPKKTPDSTPCFTTCLYKFQNIFCSFDKEVKCLHF